MKIKEKFFKFYKSAKFWWFVVAFIVSLLIWFVGPGISFYGMAPLADIGVQFSFIILVFLFWFFVHFKTRLKQHWQGSRIFSDESVTVPLNGLINRKRSRMLRRDVRRLLQFMRGREVSRFWFFKRGHLYYRPWYLVMGAPNSGKTSLVRHAHLNFISQSYQQERVVSGAFDYALAQEALLFDVHADLFVQKALAERHLWFTLLKAIKRARRQRPLNGVIVCVSLKQLLDDDQEHKQKLFEHLRLRLHEVQQKLGMSIPIYVMVNELDYLSGFTDFVVRLLDAERAASLGVTFSVHEVKALDQFVLEYDLLLEHLNFRLLRHLEGDYSVAVYANMLYFMVQMAALKAHLFELAQQVFLERGVFHRNHWRGIYFLAHQVRADESFDVLSSERSLNMMELPRVLRDKHCFVKQIFADAILSERELVGVHPWFHKHFSFLRQGWTLLFGALTCGILSLWALSAHQYLNYNAGVVWQLQHQREVRLKSSDAMLNTIYMPLDALAQLYAASDTYGLHLGLWVPHSGVDAARQLYQRALVQEFLPYVVLSLQQNLANVVQDHSGNMASIQNLYYGLSSYLMLQDLDHLDELQMERVLNQYWSERFAHDMDLQSWLLLRLQDLLNLSFPSQNLSSTLVSQARAMLWNSPVYMQAYLRLKLDVLQEDVKTINVIGDLSADANEIFVNLNTAVVSEFFTRRGYENIYKVKARHYLDDTASQSWVFGSQYQTHYSHADLDQFETQMQLLYWQDYLNAWNNALMQVNFASFNDLESELSILQLLSSHHSPLSALINNIVENTNFSNETMRAGRSLFGKNQLALQTENLNNYSADNVVSNQFAPLAQVLNAAPGQTSVLDAVNSALNTLQQYLNGLANSSNPNLSAYNAAVQIFQGQADRSITALASLAAQMPQPMARWLNQIVANTYAVIFACANHYLSTQWQAEVVSFYQQALAGRYPFVLSQNEVTVQDFSNFFKPGGVEDSFVKKYLMPFVSSDNFGHVTWQSVNNIPFSSNEALVDEISSASTIRNTFFGGVSNVLNFTLMPQSLVNLHKFSLTYDGKTVVNNGDSSTGVAFVWPPMNTDGSVNITFERLLETDVDQNYSGPWGLFRLLEHSNLVRSHYGSSYNLSISDDGMSANFILSASSVNNPFDLRLLRDYRCPDKF